MRDSATERPLTGDGGAGSTDRTGEERKKEQQRLVETRWEWVEHVHWTEDS